ncbi:hypothetical protein C0993_010828 [Termitomyces sp. T159_Od127]|nr:hypothetical protein C0993_010828 [Termitomyces sp. T159_Od127]
MSTKTTGKPTSSEDRIVKMVFQALQAELSAQLQAISQLQARVGDIQGGLEALAGQIAVLEALGGQVTELERGSQGSSPRPHISPPDKYNGVSKQLADQFISQVEAAAKFERFRDERQKVLWAQLYLSGLALMWSCIIMTSVDNTALNPWCFWLGGMAH